ncbi:MAG: class I SAM-dependent methyltransferase [Patescibacteria group bacterium]
MSEQMPHFATPEAESKEESNTYEKHYDDTRNMPPAQLLVDAVKYVVHKDKALDVGAGALRDTRFLLEQGFDVVAIDQSPLLAKEAEAVQSEKLHYVITSFDSFDFPENEYDIVSSTAALSFNHPDTFNEVFEKIKKSVKREGILSVNIFGTNDEWNTDGNERNMTFLSKDEVEKLFEGFKIITFYESEKDSTTADKKPKHWHIFRVIAKRQ